MTFVNETLHPEAQDLTALLFKAGSQDPEERCYDVLTGFVQGVRVQGNVLGCRTNEEAADLYSLIIESDYANAPTRAEAVTRVSRCLWLNQRRFQRG